VRSVRRGYPRRQIFRVRRVGLPENARRGHTTFFMTIDDYKILSPYQQEMIALLTRIAKALEGIEKEASE